MSFRNKFNQLFKRQTIANSQEVQGTGFEALVPDQEITFDDLAKVPFAGDCQPAIDAHKNDVKPNKASAQTPEMSMNTSTPEPEITKEGTIREFSKKSAEFYQDFPSDAPLPAEFTEERQTDPRAQAFRNLFKTDLRIKKELIDLAPSSQDCSSEASRIEYVDRTYGSLRGLKHDFFKIVSDFSLNEDIKDEIEDFFRRNQENFMVGNYSPEIPSKLYQNAFTNIRPDYIEKVKEASQGYVIRKENNLTTLTRDATTINELLHAYHSCLTNDENILQAVPEVAHKASGFGYTIVWRGDKTAMAQQVFDAIPEELGIGITDIVAIDDYLAIMVRDRGHALAISSEPDERDPQKIWVNYSIPKLCNAKMIEALPGINKYSENGARGGFVVDRSKIGGAIADFISRVPTDDDIFREGSDYYEQYVQRGY